MDRVVMRFTEAEDRLMKLEKMINPLLDDNDQNALSYILDNIINEKIKTMSESWPFMKPVNKKQVKDYYEKIKQPMDLESMSKKISSHKYHSRQEFVDDMKLIYNNSLTFNGEHSEFTMKAKMLLDVVEETLIPFAEHCELLEAKIRVAQKRAIEQAEIDSLGTSITDDQEPRRKKKRRHNTSGTADMSPGEDAGDILDDLQYRYDNTDNVVHNNNAVIGDCSSEEEEDDWDEVEDSQDGSVAPPAAGFTISVDQSALDNIVAQEDQPKLDEVRIKYEPQEIVVSDVDIVFFCFIFSCCSHPMIPSPRMNHSVATELFLPHQSTTFRPEPMGNSTRSLTPA